MNKKMSKYKFKLPIGDWSQDGHNLCDYFTIESNVPVEECVDPYIEACQRWGIDKLCSECGYDTIDEDVRDFLVDEGFNRDLFPEFPFDKIPEVDLAEIVINSIMMINGSICLEIINDDIPLFCNWLGQKVKGIKGGRVFDLPGYGSHSM